MADRTFDLADLVSLCKRRGFIFQSSEIYGGFPACFDYGPLGVELKNRVKEAWWDVMVRSRDDIVGMDGSILMHPTIWKASGHVEHFHDPLVECKKCHQRFRQDSLPEGTQACPECGGPLTEPRNFNLMFKTLVGPVEEEASVAYLRPETCQTIYVNFKNIQTVTRKRLPFGIAQIGKAFRNEITTKRFIFRQLEFEQMEMQFFVSPEEDEKWFEYWLEQRQKYYRDLGIASGKIRLYEHPPDKRAHYARAAFDIEYDFPFGWGEVEGVHNRTDYDLTQHAEFSGKDLAYRDDRTGKKYVPFVIETSTGVDRQILMFLCDAFREEEEIGEGHKRETRLVLGFHPRLAPITVAVFPLSRKDELIEPSRRLEEDLRREGFRTEFDVTGAIGKRYRRQDEVGTPFCITYDFDSITDQAVTIRHRDTMDQERVGVTQTAQRLRERIRDWDLPGKQA
jgi:glycyl-tRNA synthetase